MDFERVQAEWVLDRFPREQLPEVAAQAMMAGFEGPFILDLVGYALPSLHQLKSEVVEGAFREMGLSPLTPEQAVFRLACHAARRLLRKETTSMSFYEEVWRLLDRLEDYYVPDQVNGFRELSWELEDGDVPKHFDHRVVELAWSLLEDS
jgi:hypothetical protein